MTTPRQQRLAGSFGWRTTRRDGPAIERALRGLGAERGFADDVIGDLVEERAARAARDGTVAANAWYLAEAVRAVPHLAWNALRHGSRDGRTRIAAIIAGLALIPAVVFMAVLLHSDGPARLVVDGQNGVDLADGLIVNSRHPVRLSMHAFDAKGRPMSAKGVRYEWTGGTPMRVSPNGVITCRESGDATLRATAGSAATTVLVRCRPVKTLRSYNFVEMVAGGAPVTLPLQAEGPDGETVALLAGERVVRDTTVVQLRGGRIHPLAPGLTYVRSRFGDAEAFTSIGVYEPVPTLAGLRDDQRMVIAPVHLARGASITWPLPVDQFFLTYHPAERADPTPAFQVEGLVMCMPDFAPTVRTVDCLVRGRGATVRITNTGRTPVDGQVSLQLWGTPAHPAPIFP